MYCSPSAGVIAPVWTIVSITVSRRCLVSSGLVNGLNRLVDCTMPASIAACGTVRSAASTPKYVWAAVWTPNAPLPNETRLRYLVRISSLLSSPSRVSAIRISLILRAGVVSTAARRSASFAAETRNW